MSMFCYVFSIHKENIMVTTTTMKKINKIPRGSKAILHLFLLSWPAYGCIKVEWIRKTDVKKISKNSFYEARFFFFVLFCLYFSFMQSIYYILHSTESPLVNLLFYLFFLLKSFHHDYRLCNRTASTCIAKNALKKNCLTVSTQQCTQQRCVK